MEIFTSNKIESLISILKETVFQTTDPFSKRYVVVYHYHMAKTLQAILASEAMLGIVSGILWRNLSSFMLEARELFFEKTASVLSQERLFYEILSYLHSLKQIPENWKAFYQTSSRLVELASFLTQDFFESYFIDEELRDQKLQEHPDQKACYEKIFAQYGQYSEVSLLKQGSVQVHLFNCPSFPQPFFDLLSKTKAEMFFYQRMPTYHHLDFTYSQREQKAFSGLQTLCLKIHPMIEEMGSVYRKTQRLFEKDLMQEFFVKLTPNSCLQQLQEDLLEMTPCQEALQADDSIMLHLCGSKYLEIQNLLEYIRLWVEQGVVLDEIAVYAPCIEEYQSAIRALFDQQIPYKITDLNLLEHNTFCRGLKLLFEIKEEKWSAQAVVKLLSYPPFLKKHPLFEKEKRSFKKLIETLHLEMNAQGFQGWQEALKALLINQMTGADFIDLPELHLLEALLVLLQKLEEQLEALYQQKQSLKQWSLTLASFVQEYFEAEDKAIFLRTLDPLNEQSDFIGSVDFPLFYALCERQWNKEKTEHHRSQTNVVSFSSIALGNIKPCKVLCLLGMDQESFPRQDRLYWRLFSKHIPLNQSDRMFFLEACLTPHRALFLSSTQTEKSLATHLVHELKPYLQIYQHPAILIDPCYFQKEGKLLNRNEKHFKALCATSIQKKASHFQFSFTQHVLEFKALGWFLRFPFKTLIAQEKNVLFSKDNDLNPHQFFLSSFKREKELLTSQVNPRQTYQTLEGAFKQLEVQKKQELKLELEQKCDLNQLKQVLCAPSETKVHLQAHCIAFPLIEKEGKQFFGDVGFFEGSRLLVQGKLSWDSFFMIWPVLSVISEIQKWIEFQEVVFSKGTKSVDLRFPFYFEKLFEYADLIVKHYWLKPCFVPLILKKEEKKLSLQLEQIIDTDVDFKLLSQLQLLPKAKEMIDITFDALTKIFDGIDTQI